ncbi:LysR family transcriptional regulator [Nesterenkonia sp. Hz 6-5]|nr:LysR family transcriptional regulator [Nesterenkonia haasae]
MGSFTIGAAAAQIPQSVASRRVAALENELGARLIDRSGRRATPTPFGVRLLPRARRLVQLADSLRRDAVHARAAPVRLAVPATCEVRDLAVLGKTSKEAGLVLDLHRADPVDRAEQLRTHDVEVAIIAVAPDQARWAVPLGLAGIHDEGSRPIHLDTLRGRRHSPAGVARRIWMQPEDDVPTIRDRFLRLRDSAGLAPSQVQIAATLTNAVTETLASGDLLMCSSRQATEFGLHWRAIALGAFERTYALRGVSGSDAAGLAASLDEPIGKALGVGHAKTMRDGVSS